MRAAIRGYSNRSALDKCSESKTHNRAKLGDSSESTILLWEAARLGCHEMLADAVRNGADVNARNPDHCRWGALHYAVHHDDPYLLASLVNAGARADLPCNLRVRAMHLAAINGSSKAVSFLLNAGANPRPPDQYGRTPLHYAASAGHLSIAKMLLAAGADVDPQDFVGSTPLASAARNGHTQVVQHLVHHGADLRTEDRLGYTAYGAAVKKGHLTAAAACRAHSIGKITRPNQKCAECSQTMFKTDKVYCEENFWEDEIG